jgi:hypothetical protein
MTSTIDRFEAARAVADAVLYEGYLLYPYRASAPKNQMRWQFGVLAPRAYAEGTGSERANCRTECIVDPGADPKLTVRALPPGAAPHDRGRGRRGGLCRGRELEVDGGASCVGRSSKPDIADIPLLPRSAGRGWPTVSPAPTPSRSCARRAAIVGQIRRK